MKVLIDTHMLGQNEGGNERYVKNLFGALSKMYPGEVDKYAPQKPETNLSRLLVKIPYLVNKNKYDIVHSTYNSPFIKNAKFIVTLHDLSFKRFPRHFSLKERYMFQNLLPISLHRAEGIIVPTEFTKSEAIEYFPFIKNKVHVTYYAADREFHKVNEPKGKDRIRNKYKIDKPYMLCLNSRYQKKNVQTVVNAFNHIKDRYPDLQLVIIGGDHNLDKSTLGERVYRLSFIDDQDLNYFYNFCEIFIYYSIYEGFGLPILEAINCERPVIMSDTKVHREITKNKLIYGVVDSFMSLGRQISVVLDSSKVKDDLIKAARELRTAYSWEETAKNTYNIYRSILD